ncbi:MAG: polysaccharide biosynthesis protein [Clostridia bacterium]|nr:polysaccharide biosynthesis protein [Clostridia bacterium]
MDLKTTVKGNYRRVLLFLFDMFCLFAIEAAYFIATHYFAKEGVSILGADIFIYNALLIFITTIVFRTVWGVYNYVWRYTSTGAYLRIVLADMCAGMVSVTVSYISGQHIGVWFFITIASLSALVALSARFVYRLLYKRKYNLRVSYEQQSNAAIIGAGQLGAYLVNELKSNPNSLYRPVLFFDNDPAKIGGTVANLHVYSEENAVAVLKKYDISNVILAIVGISSEEITRLHTFYTGLGCKVKIYDSPVHDEADDGDGQKKRVIREFEIEDLLFRKPLAINGQKEFDFYSGKTVLVTGGGGSIGSELCRQIAKCSPKKLIILDIYENNAYDIQQELTRKYGAELDLAVEIASVRDRKRLEAIFANYRPELVFHAAAHKHVPLMEHSGCEAVKNNVLGTYNTADMAEKYGVQKFVLISTDKAVNPTNIMGASKRMCEMVIQCRTDSKTTFAAVRFGNVLGSNGSVIPLFKRQIANGGPITITDFRIIRYFMTIPEASQLVMQAGAMAKRGELFVLDMGKPIKIYDLAVNMIKLSGLVPGKDIEIKEVGLRPGEKLYEELLIKTEELTKTDNNMIFVEKDASPTRKAVDEKIDILTAAVTAAENELGSEKVKAAMKQVVPTFHDPEEVNEKAAKTK